MRPASSRTGSDTRPLTRRAVLTAALAAALLVGACGTTKREGHVGDTLRAGGLRATLIKFDAEVPAVRDYSGLGAPGPGMRLFGVKTKVCNDRGRAIGAYDFGLELDGGDKTRLRFPQGSYSDGFEGLRDGCERGWIVFEGPAGSRAKSVTFSYDETGSGGPGGEKEKHARFRWD